MDITASALKHSLIPLQEYLLQGSINDTNREVLLHRLNGLCDTVITGPEKFYDHEMVYTIRSPGVQPLSLRVRRALDHPDLPWHMRYIGQPDVVDQTRPTTTRSCFDIGTSDNVVQFLQEMGFRLDFEYVLRGYLFRKGRMKITVSQLFKMLHQGNTDSVESMGHNCLVELSLVLPQGQEHIADDIKNFAEQLKPLVQLEKVDHRRLQQQLGGGT